MDIRKTAKINIIGDAHHLPFRNSVFSEIVLFEVIEHLLSPHAAIREAKRALISGGILKVQIPNLYYIGRILWQITGNYSRLKESWDTNHINAWDQVTISNFLTSFGLKVNKIRYLPYGYQPLHAKILAKFPLPPILKFTHLKVEARS